MAHEQFFLGWNQPVLPRAAGWLHGRFANDMSGVVVVLPSARAGRRLGELLAETLRGQPWSPPQIVTVGHLPELLYAAPANLTTEFQALLIRTQTLQDAPAAMLAQVVPHRPTERDFAAWWELAEQLGGLSGDLASHELQPRDVGRLAADAGQDMGLSQSRWDAISQLEALYEAALPHPDRTLFRRHCIQEGNCFCDQTVVLLGLPDLSPLVAAMVAACEMVISLVAAPEQHEAGFGSVGGLVVDYWQNAHVDLADVRFVDGPTQQAHVAATVVAQLGPDVAADEVVVGLGDEANAPGMERTFKLAGAVTRFAGGRPSTHTGPAILLERLARYGSRRQLGDLASLLRHPDFPALLGDASPWINRLDDYASTFLLTNLDEPWQADSSLQKQVDKLKQVVDQSLLQGLEGNRTLAQWAPATLKLLQAVYGDRVLSDPAHHATAEALAQLAELLAEHQSLGQTATPGPPLRWVESVTLLLRQLSGCLIPPPADAAAVELLGFLELPLDDAPHLILTDLNEGLIPDSQVADAFLPNSLRRTLGMPDDRRRYARDLLSLQVISQSRKLVVVVPRHTRQGDPLKPSRLLFACTPEQQIQRLESFYLPHTEKQPAPPPELLHSAARSSFRIPYPLLMDAPLAELSVTGFRTYLACPYRFFLQHILKLRSVDDRTTELGPAAFGSLAHGILENFAHSDVVHATDPQAIFDFLSDALDQMVHARFGPRPRAALALQIAQLRERLGWFATRQAAEAQEGWRIQTNHVEEELRSSFQVDGLAFTIRGRIDRIEVHPTLGCRVLDYKTSDTAKTPAQQHRSKGRWTDLQLPLYAQLVAEIGIERPLLGYFNLPKSADATEVVLLKGDAADLAEAWAERDRVVRCLRSEQFWPPSENPPAYGDEFSRIAADLALGRADLIERSASDSGEGERHV